LFDWAGQKNADLRKVKLPADGNSTPQAANAPRYDSPLALTLAWGGTPVKRNPRAFPQRTFAAGTD
jgi:hypothetical protein